MGTSMKASDNAGPDNWEELDAKTGVGSGAVNTMFAVGENWKNDSVHTVCLFWFERKQLAGNNILLGCIPCRETRVHICIPHQPHHGCFLLKHRLYRGKVYGIKAKFLSFHRERGEAGEYCLRMFHIPTALPVLTACSLLLSLFLNHSSLLCISPFPSFFSL